MQSTQSQSKTATDSITLVDVRTPSEFAEVHAVGAINIPLADVKKFARDFEDIAERKTIHLMCRTERRAKMAKEALAQLNITATAIVPGGITRWVEEGKDVERGTKGISIERQVRICAGALVVTGAALGYFLNPAFIALSAFVGAGLVFAGITDTCGMAMMLGQLPFNRIKTQTSSFQK